MPSRTIVYSALGHLMQVFELDADTGHLAEIQSLVMPEIVQYGWPNRARTMFYIAMSGAGPMVKLKRRDHFVQAFRIGRNGELEAHQEPIRLGNRPLHLSLDAMETHLLFAYNDPPDVTVHRILADGRIGEEVKQQTMDFGITVHQVRVTPPGNIAVVPACAHDDKGHVAGSVGLFSYREGVLAPRDRMVADPARADRWKGIRHGAHGFAARHVDFHPTKPWMYMCIETQGEIRLYDYTDDAVALEPRFIKSTLEGVPPGRSAQMASAIHVHPNGRFVYVSNRAWEAEQAGDKKVFVGGVNDIAVFEIDQATGEPRLIQHVDTLGIFPRTFGIDPSNRILVVGNQEPFYVRSANGIERVPASLVAFRIGDDGRLAFLHKHDHPDNGDVCFWIGVESL